MAKQAFSGFPKEGLQFLRNLEKNNDRDWFQPRKETYEAAVKTPMTSLLLDLNAELKKFAPEHVCDPAKAIYRIYRDTRFSNDKTPYKTHIAANLPRHGLSKHAAAGFYFSVSPKSVDVAGGVYMPGPEETLAIRMHLSLHHKDFEKAVAKAAKTAGPLRGEELSRVPKGFAPDQPAAPLIRKKQWYFYEELDPKLAASSALLKALVARFKAMAPVVAILNQPLLRRRPSGPVERLLD